MVDLGKYCQPSYFRGELIPRFHTQRDFHGDWFSRYTDKCSPVSIVDSFAMIYFANSYSPQNTRK